jgi:hypothetical protein
VLAAGWPFAYLYDSPAISARGTFGLEDDFKPGWFLADTAIFGASMAAGAAIVTRLRRRASP